MKDTKQQELFKNGYPSSDWFYDFMKRHPEWIQRIAKNTYFDSHISIELIESAKQRNIYLAKLPPHTTHFLQGFDVSVFLKYKTKMEKGTSKSFYATEKCKNIDKPDFPKLLNASINACNLKTKLIDGFDYTVIYFFNKNKIPKSTFDINNNFQKNGFAVIVLNQKR